MNLLYMKYALEVASCGSISKAAERLYLDQPNLSRSIKDLELSLGVSLFERSSKGMKPTPDGERFLSYARTILSQVDALESLFRQDAEKKLRFTISVPRASYISDAFVSFSNALPKQTPIEIFYKETNALRALRNILEEDYKLGIIRYAGNYDRYYRDMLEEKGLAYELVTEFRYVLIMSEKSPLASIPSLRYSDLSDKTMIAHADPYVPYLPFSEVKKEELPDIARRIFVYERGSQFELLSENLDTFMWVSPVPAELLKRYGLVQRLCQENTKKYKDVMIYRKDYKLSALDRAFISELCRVKEETFEQIL